MCMHHAYIYPPIAKFVDTWTQPYKSLPVYGLAVSSGLACVQRKLDTRSHAVVIACYPLFCAVLKPWRAGYRAEVTPAGRVETPSDFPKPAT
jgi:hypothetical protein